MRIRWKDRGGVGEGENDWFGKTEEHTYITLDRRYIHTLRMYEPVLC